MLARGWLSHELTLGRVGGASRRVCGKQVAPFDSGDEDGLQAALLPSLSRILPLQKPPGAQEGEHPKLEGSWKFFTFFFFKVRNELAAKWEAYG